MKRIAWVAAVLCSIVAYSPAFADSIKGVGPEVIDMKMGEVQLKFLHWKHQASNNNECINCHKSEGGKIEGWGKEAAHTLCIPCHDMNEKGPVECKQCHK